MFQGVLSVAGLWVVRGVRGKVGDKVVWMSVGGESAGVGMIGESGVLPIGSMKGTVGYGGRVVVVVV